MQRRVLDNHKRVFLLLLIQLGYSAGWVAFERASSEPWSILRTVGGLICVMEDNRGNRRGYISRNKVAEYRRAWRLQNLVIRSLGIASSYMFLHYSTIIFAARPISLIPEQ